VDQSEGTLLCPIRLTELAVEQTGKPLGKNIVALGVLGDLFEMDRQALEDLVRQRFASKGEEIVERNVRALRAGYGVAENQRWPRRYRLHAEPDAGAGYMLLSGNEAVALGAIVAGCRFAAGYPITPATPIFEALAELMPRVGGEVLQMEDEIASISAAIGASFTGKKAITPTSGPGLQLMGEQLNLASMLELPIVIVDVQRGGPSTGLPTKTEQSDLKLAIYGTSGESPRVVLAPTGVEDSFYQTIRAFNIAERYQLPVIILTDQSIGYRRATVRIPDLARLSEVPRATAPLRIAIPQPGRIDIASRIEPTGKELLQYKRFRNTPTGVSPIARPGTRGGQYLATGLEHTESGKADSSPLNHLEMSRKRFRKLESLSRLLEKNPREYHGSQKSKIGIIGWGSTEGAIREARYLAEKRGIMVRHLHPRIVSPLPERRIREFLNGLKQLVIVEENYTGQFAHFVNAKFGVRPIEVHKCEGVPITPEEIYTAIEKVARVVDEDSLTRL
jgi:2-oxoglutarate ferredoxin oxidoreductase subunit alpha